MNNQLHIKRTESEDPDFQLLIRHLDHELWNELHEDQSTYDQFNQVKGIQTAVVAYVNGRPGAIGCFKKFYDDTIEIKRMFVEKEFRGWGLSKQVLHELEQWARESGYQYAILETSVHFKVAQNLYTGSGYEIIENYDQYKGLKESVCMKKNLDPGMPGESSESEYQDPNTDSDFFRQSNIEYFDFEQDFVEENVRCIPMIVRFKMDKAGIKLKLKEWSKFSLSERLELAKMTSENKEDVERYRDYLVGLIRMHMGNAATDMEVDQRPGWDNADTVPVAINERMNELGSVISVNQWRGLTRLQRFALMKLCRPGHESRNFARAVKEFGLGAAEQKITPGFLPR